MIKNKNIILSMKGMVKDFPGVRALDYVDFSVYEGEVHCLLGENGAGKSTLIKILTGVHQPDEGEISFLGQQLKHITPRLAQQVGISAIYQELQLVPTLTIAENVFLGREPVNSSGSIDFGKMKTDTLHLFKQLDIDVDPDWLVGDISIGLRQMTEVIKVLARGGKLVIMDEPTTALNESETNYLFSTIIKLKKNGISVIYISHRMEEIFEVGDRASVIRDGHLIGTVEIRKTSSSKLISMMVGRTIKEKYYKEKVKLGGLLWKGENLINETRIIQKVSFQIHEGEILGLTGLRGSGFKELARTISGVEQTVSGFMKNSKGEKYQFKDPKEAIMEGIGYLPDDRKGEGLVLVQTIRNNLILPIIQRISTKGWVDDKKADNLASEYVKVLNIQTPSINKSVEFLSGGNQQKVVLAKWLASQCNLLVLDAPTQGIDVGAKIEMYKLIANHIKNKGAVILVSSELPELLTISDRIIVIRQGKVVGNVDSKSTTQKKILHMAAAGQTVYESGKKIQSELIRW